MKPEYIVLHHSRVKEGKALSWNGMRDYHEGHLGHDMVGFHFGIEKQMRSDRVNIYIGRYWYEVGQHCDDANMNARSLAILLIGDFNLKPVPVNMWRSAIRLSAALMEAFGIPHIKVLGHREVKQVGDCPGKQFDMKMFRQQLWEKWIGFTTVA